MSTQYAFGRIVTDGLVLALNAADRNSYVSGSTVWNDVSGNGNIGTLTNGPTFNSGSGGSIVFDGTNDYVSIPHNNLFNFTNQITLVAWFKTSQASAGYITSKTDDSFYFAIGEVSNGKLSFYLNGVLVAWFGSNQSVNTGNWVHGAATWDGSLTTLYINGYADNSISKSGTIPTGSNQITVGARINPANPGGNRYLNGALSNVLYYNKALSAQEVLQNYNAQKSRFGL